MIEKRFELVPFPGPSIPSGLRVEGAIRRTGSMLYVTYEILGPIDLIDIPAPSLAPERRHELWKETCLELFLGLTNSPAYWEFNFSPSGHWNAYAFDDYRKGMKEESAIDPLHIDVRSVPDRLELAVSIDTARIIMQESPLQVGVSAVIRMKEGAASYWAIAHVSDRPDFHQRECFIPLPSGTRV